MRTHLLLALAASAAVLLAQPAPEAWAVPTFESLGVYYNQAAPAKAPCTIRYRAAGASDWRDGYPLVYDAREHQYRGSLVLLKPDTAYEIRLEAGSSHAEFQARSSGDERLTPVWLIR